MDFIHFGMFKLAFTSVNREIPPTIINEKYMSFWCETKKAVQIQWSWLVYIWIILVNQTWMHNPSRKGVSETHK